MVFDDIDAADFAEGLSSLSLVAIFVTLSSSVCSFLIRILGFDDDSPRDDEDNELSLGTSFFFSP